MPMKALGQCWIELIATETRLRPRQITVCKFEEENVLKGKNQDQKFCVVWNLHKFNTKTIYSVI